MQHKIKQIAIGGGSSGERGDVNLGILSFISFNLSAVVVSEYCVETYVRLLCKPLLLVD